MNGASHAGADFFQFDCQWIVLELASIAWPLTLAVAILELKLAPKHCLTGGVTSGFIQSLNISAASPELYIGACTAQLAQGEASRACKNASNQNPLAAPSGVSSILDLATIG